MRVVGRDAMATLTEFDIFALLRDLDGPFAFLRDRGAWWWWALGLGALLRLHFVIFTEGTYDVLIWQSHAAWIRQYGLIGYYEWQEVFNAPPFMGYTISVGWAKALSLGVPFPIFMRAPVALLDLGTAFLLSRVFRDSPGRHLVFACYWLNPVAIIFSSYHGNTDSVVAFLALLGTLAAIRGYPAGAGAALGVGLWVKLPTLLVIPAIFFYFAGSRRRLTFITAAGLTALVAWLPALLEAPGLVYERVIAYQGLQIETKGGVPIWTIWSIFGAVEAAPGWLRAALESAMELHAEFNSLVCLFPVVLLAWLRRRERTGSGLGRTVLGGFLLFYAFNNNFFSFQYLAWSTPFWFFAPPVFPALATLTIGSYVYGAYALFCGDLLLRGRWNFNAFPQWPGWLLGLRDASLLLCFVSATYFLVAAARRELRPGTRDPSGAC